MGVPGIECSTGSLGHGLPIACGMALAGRERAAPFRVFAVLSDGECDEGSVWEAALFAGHHGLDNLTVIVDYNRVQSMGFTDEVLRLDPLAGKWQSFGWHAVEVDGHSVEALQSMLKALPLAPGKPTCIVANTVKGKGVSFMEHQLLWHYRTPQGDEYTRALAELGASGGMRTAFFETLVDLAASDERVFLLTGDLGYGVVETFARRYPSRFINVGVAEQNMTGVATGLALSGKVVFTYSIANFPTLRCLEQIRNGPCYHNANVKVVSVGGGLAYGSLGMSHHATEDLAVMRALPNLTVVAPGDPIETRAATESIVRRDGPVYLRLGRAGEPVIHKHPVEFELGRALQLRDGHDLTLISTGGMLATAEAVAAQLERDGIGCRLLSMHTIKPLDTRAVLAAAVETRLVVTLEEHSILGGLGGAVAEVMAEATVSTAPLKRIGLPSAFASRSGSRDYLANEYGLSEGGILGTVRALLERTPC